MTIRLATFDIPAVHQTLSARSVQLATSPSKQSQGSTFLLGERPGAQFGDMAAPALLVSYVYLAPFLKNRHRYHYRDWVLDSGAFSAHNSGVKIDLQAYIKTAKELLATDPTLTEVFALDVIGDAKASLKNCEAMWNDGIRAIPCYHIGEPVDALLCMARDYPKIAIGGMTALRGGAKLKWAEQCFARVWPKPIHGFGAGSESLILGVPWHSVDATNWELGPCKFGRWQSFGNMSVRGSNQNLRSEVEWYLALEQRARIKWAKQMAELEADTPTVRLACNGPRMNAGTTETALTPSRRLDASGDKHAPEGGGKNPQF